MRLAFEYRFRNFEITITNIRLLVRVHEASAGFDDLQTYTKQDDFGITKAGK